MSKLAALSLLLASFLVSVSSHAAEGQWYLVPGAQWMEFDDETPLEERWGPFYGLGYDLTDRTSLEVSGFDLDPKLNGGGQIDLDHFKFDIYRNLSDDGGFTPFIVGGVGNTNFGGENDTLLDLGVGFKYQLTENVVWRTAVRSYNYLGRDQEDRDIGVDTGLVFYFGDNRNRRAVAASPAPVRTPSAPLQPEEPAAPATQTLRDSDRDGVPDVDDDCPNTPMEYAVDSDGCPITTEEVAREELEVYFEFDRSEVQEQYFPEIEELADFLEQYPDVVADLEGHTDSIGTDEYNMDLSERRVNAVREVLINRYGIPDSRITTTAFGESQPVATNETAAGRAQNRRVITVVLRTQQRYRPR